MTSEKNKRNIHDDVSDKLSDEEEAQKELTKELDEGGEGDISEEKDGTPSIPGEHTADGHRDDNGPKK
jgi:hypothetical protein